MTQKEKQIEHKRAVIVSNCSRLGFSGHGFGIDDTIFVYMPPAEKESYIRELHKANKLHCSEVDYVYEMLVSGVYQDNAGTLMPVRSQEIIDMFLGKIANN